MPPIDDLLGALAYAVLIATLIFLPELIHGLS
jgi:hypothetical protein